MNKGASVTTKEEGKDLAIKEIAPRVGGGVPAERLKVPKTGHLSGLDCAVAESDRLERKKRDKVGVGGSFRTCVEGQDSG